MGVFCFQEGGARLTMPGRETMVSSEGKQTWKSRLRLWLAKAKAKATAKAKGLPKLLADGLANKMHMRSVDHALQKGIGDGLQRFRDAHPFAPLKQGEMCE